MELQLMTDELWNTPSVREHFFKHFTDILTLPIRDKTQLNDKQDTHKPALESPLVQK